tara:strand:- start:8 stop:721 length:714 start_codon:yes stop_codon:yes gene_type:complete
LIVWKNKALVLSKINYSETSLILKIFTEKKGIQTGLVRGGKNIKKSNIFEAGNLVLAECKARTEDSLSILNCELLEANSGIFIEDSSKFLSIIALLNLIEFSLLENEAEEELFLKSYILIKNILSNQNFWLEDYVKWELFLLKKIGFGLELNKCIVSNSSKSLSFVSPKSGCAVSKEAAIGWESKLLPLPSFLISSNKANTADIKNGLSLTTFFLLKFSKSINKNLPFTRKYFIDSI